MKKTVIITFMRCQLPHIGHGMLWDKMRELWLLDPKNSSYHIFLSKTHDQKKNPLSFAHKLSIVKQLWPLHQSRVSTEHGTTIIKVMKELDGKYDNVVFVCGPDRAEQWAKMLLAYNRIEYNFKSISIKSYGVRDSALTGISGISGTLMRRAITNKDFSTFASGLPLASLNITTSIYTKIINDISYLQAEKDYYDNA